MSAADPEAAYYQAVEDFFVSRRGDPLFLSNADWLVIRRWRSEGIPLRIVLRGIADALDAHAQSWGRERKIGSLRYCEAEVDAARERWQRALALDGEEANAAAATLKGLGRSLDEARDLRPPSRTIARRLAGEIAALAGGPVVAREVEPRLQQAEQELLEVLRAEAAPNVVAELERHVDAALAPYRDRMPPRVFDDLRTQSVARELLACHGLPRLSLFGL